MNLKLWPLIKYDIDKWTVPDEVLAGVWQEMVKNKRVETTFYDGEIVTAQGFIDFMKDPLNFVVLVADLEKTKIVALGWVNEVKDGTAHSHFCFPGRFIPGAGEMVIEYWKSFRMTKVFVGITPESYKTVLKIIQKWGFKQVGVIPEYLNMAYKGRREGGVISQLGG